MIVPVYKVEQYFDRCVRSILDQSFADFELILVDDGSPDQCPEMCDKYAREDGRIIVIHKENGGLSDARNAGIRSATGKFLFFVDSDDYIKPNALFILVKTQRTMRADVVISTTFCSVSDDEHKKEIQGPTDGSVFTANASEALEEVFCVNTRWEACGTLFNSTLFIDQLFPNGRLYEDIWLIPQIIMRAKRICFLNECVYYYCLRQDSIMRGSKERISSDLSDACTQIIRKVGTLNYKFHEKNNIIGGVLCELASRIHLAERSKLAYNCPFIKQGRRLLCRNIYYGIVAKKVNNKKKMYLLLVLIGANKTYDKVKSVG